jgi:pimeloyl-ACP methyl ester carboxylesterase
MNWANRILKWFLYLILVITLIVLAGVGYLWFKSPGMAQPILDASGGETPGSISTIEQITLGGVDQTMIIRGMDAEAPVILFLHGGPGSPEYAFFRATNQGLEDDFVMVYWEQRGAGKSYDPGLEPGTLTLDQMVADTAELSTYLIERFNKKKIYLMGHSWGSALAMLSAKSHPELFHKMFTIGQIANQYEGEKLSFEWVKVQAEQKQDAKAIESLSSMIFPDIDAHADEWITFVMAQRRYLEKYGGGSVHKAISFLQMVGMVLDAPEYTLKDKLDFMKGSQFSLRAMWPELIATDLAKAVPSVEVPIVIIHGLHDMTTPYSLARSYYEELSAPEKYFYTFENSAHGVIFEEPERFNALVRDHAS